jgi:hypothetical protein
LSRLPAGYPLKGWIGSNVRHILPGCTVGSRQAEHESHRESMEEDDMVMRVGNSLGKETNRWGRKGCKPEELIRGGQGLAEG